MSRSISIWIYDPVEGKEIPLNVRVNKRGKVEIKKLPAHNFSGQETPRLLEKKAAFIDVAATMFSQAWTKGNVPVWSALREEMPKRTREFRNPRRSARAEKQEHYRSLVPQEVLDFVSSDGGARVGYYHRPSRTAPSGIRPEGVEPSANFPSLPPPPSFPGFPPAKRGKRLPPTS